LNKYLKCSVWRLVVWYGHCSGQCASKGYGNKTGVTLDRAYSSYHIDTKCIQKFNGKTSVKVTTLKLKSERKITVKLE
jgi:hypothetical protein